MNTAVAAAWQPHLLLVVSGVAEIRPAKGSLACVGAKPASAVQLAPVPPYHQESLMSYDSAAPSVGPGRPHGRLRLVLRWLLTVTEPPQPGNLMQACAAWQNCWAHLSPL